MRKLTTILTALLLLFALTLAPTALAQDDEPLPTIAETVMAQADSDDSEFTTLLAAIETADPMFLELLNATPEQNGYTVFAPTDAAFQDLLDTFDMTADELLANTDLLNAALAYHIVPGEYVSGGLASLPDGFYAGTMLANNPLWFTISDDNNLMVNGADIVNPDIAASNGTIHAVGDVMIPGGMLDAQLNEGELEQAFGLPEMTEEEVESLEGTTIAAAADLEGFDTLVSSLETIAEEKPAVVDFVANPNLMTTVFAPTDAAFNQLPEGTMDNLLDNPLDLADLLGFHIAPGALSGDAIISLAEDAADNTYELLTVNGGTVTVMYTDDVLTVGGAEVSDMDFRTENGVIHVMENVITPTS